jgi:hypothetical protein
MQIVLFIAGALIVWMALGLLAVAVAGAARRGDEALRTATGLQIAAPMQRPRMLAIDADVVPVVRPWVVARTMAEAEATAV